MSVGAIDRTSMRLRGRLEVLCDEGIEQLVRVLRRLAGTVAGSASAWEQADVSRAILGLCLVETRGAAMGHGG